MLGTWCGKKIYSIPHSVMNKHIKIMSTFTKQKQYKNANI